MTSTNKTLEQRLREVNAHHEAGHAIATLAQGGCVLYVCVNNADPFSDFGASYSVPLDDVEKQVIVTLSGEGAEMILCGWTRWRIGSSSSARGDWQRIKTELLTDCSLDERRKIIKRCQARSIEILTANWPAVVRIADAQSSK